MSHAILIEFDWLRIIAAAIVSLVVDGPSDLKDQLPLRSNVAIDYYSS